MDKIVKEDGRWRDRRDTINKQKTGQCTKNTKFNRTLWWKTLVGAVNPES